MPWKKLPGFIWALPLTIFGLLIVAPFALFGWYNWAGCINSSFVWKINKRAPKFLLNIWRGHGAINFGQIVLTKLNPKHKFSFSTMRHVQAHVNQQMKLGILYPFFYAMSMIGLWAIGGHAFYDNPFEISARRAAGQYIDLVGLIEKSKITRK